MRKHPERGRLLESPYAEPFENYLGVAPIRSGDPVIVEARGLRNALPVVRRPFSDNQGGTASDDDSSLQSFDEDCRDFLCRRKQRLL